MKTFAFHILRVGIAITYLWIGILILKDPAGWSGYIQPWAIAIIPGSLKFAMISTGILDMLIGFFLLIDRFTWIAGLLGALHLATVLIVTGITEITVRDIGLLTGCIALMVESLPTSWKTKIGSKM